MKVLLNASSKSSALYILRSEMRSLVTPSIICNSEKNKECPDRAYYCGLVYVETCNFDFILWLYVRQGFPRVLHLEVDNF